MGLSLLIIASLLEVSLLTSGLIVSVRDDGFFSTAPPSSPQSARSGNVGYSISDFTVAVQWESPASDGGVGIDSYTLTGAGITDPLTVLSDQPLMATLTLLYNEMHMVSITASNCAGKSTATLVTIQEGESPEPIAMPYFLHAFSVFLFSIIYSWLWPPTFTTQWIPGRLHQLSGGGSGGLPV